MPESAHSLAQSRGLCFASHYQATRTCVYHYNCLVAYPTFSCTSCVTNIIQGYSALVILDVRPRAMSRLACWPYLQFRRPLLLTSMGTFCAVKTVKLMPDTVCFLDLPALESAYTLVKWMSSTTRAAPLPATDQAERARDQRSSSKLTTSYSCLRFF